MGQRHLRDADLQLESVGLTLLGVIFGVGVTVGFGISGPWWARTASGAATVVLLLLLVRFAAQPGRGPVARLAAWVINRDRA